MLVSGEMSLFFCELLGYNLSLFCFVFSSWLLRIQCVEERMRELLCNIIRMSKQVSLLSSLAFLNLVVKINRTFAAD